MYIHTPDCKPEESLVQGAGRHTENHQSSHLWPQTNPRVRWRPRAQPARPQGPGVAKPPTTRQQQQWRAGGGATGQRTRPSPRRHLTSSQTPSSDSRKLSDATISRGASVSSVKWKGSTCQAVTGAHITLEEVPEDQLLSTWHPCNPTTSRVVAKAPTPSRKLL